MSALSSNSTMRRAYIETSALDALLKRDVSTTHVLEQLSGRGLVTCIGTLTLNEIAQSIRVDPRVALATFAIVQDLQPRYLADPANLLEQEIRLLREGHPVDPYPSALQEEFMRNEVAGLAGGRINERFLTLVEHRWAAKFEKLPAEMERFLGDVRRLRSQSPQHAPRFRAFAQLETFFQPDLARFVGSLLEVSANEAAVIASDIKTYPAIRASIYWWWNLLFICLSDKRTPSVDKGDDYRHVVEASYCNAFISNDKQLLRSLPHLNPSLTALWLDQLLESPHRG